MSKFTCSDVINDRNLAQFYTACCTCNPVTIEYALQMKFPVNSTVKTTSTEFLGDTALHLAVKASDSHEHCFDRPKLFNHIIEQLLLQGGDVTIVNAATYSAIHTAFRKHNKNLTLPALLAGHGYNRPNVTDQYGLSHFHIACSCNKESLVENFLKHGVDINSKCKRYVVHYYSHFDGLTGLHIAAISCALETITLLLKYKADVNVKNQVGLNPIRSILKNEAYIFKTNTASVALLSGNYNKDFIDNIQLFKLYNACHEENIDELKRVITLQPNIIHASISNDSQELRHWPGFTLLHFAATFHIVSVVQFLLQYTTHDDVNSTNVHDVTPLHCVLKFYDITENYKSNQVDKILQITKCLIQHGANINFESFNRFPPIYYALRLAREFYDKEKFLQKFLKIIGSPKLSDKTEIHNLFTACLELDYDYIENSTKNGQLQKLINITTHLAAPLFLQGFTPLHFAVLASDCVMVDQLLQNGSDICAQSANGSSPLHLAEKAQMDDSLVQMILLAYKKNRTNPVDQDGLSHLHIACKHSACEVIASLIEKKTEVNCPITKNILCRVRYEKLYTIGDTPLHIIAKYGTCDENTVRLLLDKGADYTLKNEDGITPLHYFFRTKIIKDPMTNDTLNFCSQSFLDYDAVLNFILSGSAKKFVNLIDDKGWSYFHIACRMGKSNIVKKLLEKDKSLINEDKNPEKETPLHAAVTSRCLEIVRMLVDHGAEINASNSKGRTPLHHALTIPTHHEHKNEILCFLLSKLKVEESKPIDETGLTLLHIATIQNDTKTMERLLRLGLDVNSTINSKSSLWSGFTSLHLAVGFRCMDAIMILANEGADLTVKTKNGESPFDFQCTSVALAAEMVVLTEDETEDVGFSPKLYARMIDSKRFLEFLNIPLPGHSSLFQLLCRVGEVEMIASQSLIESNIHSTLDFFANKNPGYTALHFAIESGGIEKVKLLVEFGADLNAGDAYGMTPVHLACTLSNFEILKLLVYEGAYVNGRAIKYNLDFHGYCPNYELITPIHICALLKKLDFFQFLLKNGADISLTNATEETAYSMIHTADSTIRSIMSSHLRTLEFFNFSINEQDKNHAGSLDSLTLENLKKECEKLRNAKTYFDKCPRLSDLITATPRKMYHVMKQTKLQQILYSDKYDKKYPNCGFILKLQFQKGLEYKALLMKTMYSIDSFVKKYLPLPEVCIERILENLDEDDLNNLLDINNSILLNRNWFH